MTMNQVDSTLENGLAYYLHGVGIPGQTAETANANIGVLYSAYSANDTYAVYVKVSVGEGANKWQKLVTEQYVNNALGATVSWREPAKVLSTLTVLPTVAATLPIRIDGVDIFNEQRVLFANIAGARNIYSYRQSSGSFVEDSNTETCGDAVYIQEGCAGGKTYVFNGAGWVQSAQTSLDELGSISNFIGKTTNGNEATKFASTNVVSNGESLVAAIGNLDLALGSPVRSGNFVDSTLTTNANIQALDSAFSNLAKKISSKTVSSPAVIDSVAATAAKWFVRVELASDLSRVYSTELTAISNRTRTGCGFTQSATINLGETIPGLLISVDFFAGELRLLCAATSAVNVDVRRLSIIV